MRIDLYTKTILTLIAILLAISAIRPLIQPAQNAHAQSSFSNVQFTSFSGGFAAFDTGTGDIWLYSYGPIQRVHRYKISQLGKKLER